MDNVVLNEKEEQELSKEIRDDILKYLKAKKNINIDSPFLSLSKFSNMDNDFVTYKYDFHEDDIEVEISAGEENMYFVTIRDKRTDFQEKLRLREFSVGNILDEDVMVFFAQMVEVGEIEVFDYDSPNVDTKICFLQKWKELKGSNYDEDKLTIYIGEKGKNGNFYEYYEDCFCKPEGGETEQERLVKEVLKKDSFAQNFIYYNDSL